MRTAEERITEMHRRAKAAERRTVRRQMEALGALSFVLAAFVVTALLQLNGAPLIVPEDHFAGASMLSQSTGGYVLAAVLAFFIGVVITLMVARRHTQREE